MMEKEFPKVDDHMVRDIQITFYEDKHLLAVKSIVRQKTFYDRHPIVSAHLTTIINLFMNLIFIVAIWQHNVTAILAALSLTLFWGSVLRPRIQPPTPRIEYQ